MLPSGSSESVASKEHVESGHEAEKSAVGAALPPSGLQTSRMGCGRRHSRRAARARRRPGASAASSSGRSARRRSPATTRWPARIVGMRLLSVLVVLVEGEDEQAVVGLGPVDVRAEVRLQPGVALGDGAVVHVVVEVGDDERDRRERAEVGREAGQRLVGGGREVREVHPGAVLADVLPLLQPVKPARRQPLAVAGEAEARGAQLAAEVRPGERVRAGVVGDALGGSGEQREVVRLAGVGHGVGLGEVGVLLRQRVDVRRLGLPTISSLSGSPPPRSRRGPGAAPWPCRRRRTGAPDQHAGNRHSAGGQAPDSSPGLRHTITAPPCRPGTVPSGRGGRE